MSAAQKPTVGRIVWYWLGANGFESPTTEGLPITCADATQPFAAQVTLVNRDGTVNLAITDHVGHHFGHGYVELRDPKSAPGVGLHGVLDVHREEEGSYATWMPYQVNASKAAA